MKETPRENLTVSNKKSLGFGGETCIQKPAWDQLDNPCSPGDIESWRDNRQKIEVSKRKHNIGGIPRSESKIISSTVKVLSRILKLTGRERWQRSTSKIEKNRVSFHFSDLPPSFNNFKILHLSDLHLDCIPGIEENILKILDEEHVDLALITGDLQDSYTLPFTQIMPAATTLLEGIKTRLGTYCVLGNHDTHQAYDLLQNIGVRVLLNETVRIQSGQDFIFLTGLDDVHYYYTPMAHKALADSPQGFKIVAVHSPEICDLAAKHGFRLYLTGHTHGGQICLPLPLITHGIKRRFLSGPWAVGGLLGYTSRGAGTSTLPLRINCPGEVTVVTLRHDA